MKTLRIAIVAILFVLAATLAQAQTLMATTTWAANCTATATSCAVTSATGFTVGNYIWADSEQILITSVNGTTIGIRRGQNGTRAMGHDNTDRLYTGAVNHFHTNDPEYAADCTRGVGDAAYMPWINVREGYFWVCRSESSTWNGTHAATIVFDSRPAQF